MEQGLRTIWQGPRIGKKAAAPHLGCQPEGRLGPPLPVQVKAYQGRCVCVGLGIFSDCSVVVFISFTPAVAPGPFWQQGLPG